MENLHSYFDDICNPESALAEAETDKFEELNQIDNDHLEAMVAMEEIIKQRRLSEIAGMRNFTARLESLLPGICVMRPTILSILS